MKLADNFKTSGRITRREFWWRHLLALPLGLFFCIAVATVIGESWDVVPAALLVIFLVSTWGRRLHDRNLSAWWLLAALIPVAGPLFLIWQCAFRKSAKPASGAAEAHPGYGYTTVESGP